MARILFVHPDLGIGGAERLVVDAAIALQELGHNVSILTNQFSYHHCFDEFKNDLIDVTVVGDWLPRHIFGKFYALCAYIRMIYAAIYTVFVLSRNENIDIIFCDLISLGIPIFKLAKNRPKVLFYCHHPDQLLTKSESKLNKFYRMPLNYLEELTTGKADKILVNSNYTCGVYMNTFKSHKLKPDILYPTLNTKNVDEIWHGAVNGLNYTDINKDNHVFLSINRFERKKNLELIIYALKEMENLLTADDWKKVIVIIAGGYDEFVDENVFYLKELETLSEKLNLKDKVRFSQSISFPHKLWYLGTCKALVYTPENEHFGIVPIEAMYCKKPVIAVNSGGPMETIVNKETGFLCKSDAKEFANAMVQFIKDPSLIEKMGSLGRQRVENCFSFDAFQRNLSGIITQLMIDRMN